MSQGYMTQAQVNTGYGTYGPQTTAAVRALQSKLGADNSTGPGYFGPRTMAALTQLNPLPSQSQTQTNTQTLPQNQSPLLSFADSLDAAVNLAKQERNKLQLDIMAPYRGTVMASDFNSILSNMNRATDTFASDRIENAEKSTATTFKTEQIGDTLYQYEVDSRGKIIGSPQAILGGGGSGIPGFKFSNDDIGLLTSAGFTASDISNIQNDLSQLGADAVLSGLANPAQKAAINRVLTGKEPEKPVQQKVQEKLQEEKLTTEAKRFITPDTLREFYGQKALEKAADPRWWDFRPPTPQQIEAYLSTLMQTVNKYRAAGLSDQEIMKKFMEGSKKN